jgi:hypothetical protein
MRMKTLYAMLAIFVISIATVSAAYAYSANAFMPGAGNEDMMNAIANNDYEAFMEANQARFAEMFTQERFAEMAENHQKTQAIQKAIEEGDYQAWVAAVEAAQPPKITDIVNEDNFSTYVEMYNARMNGDYETAQKLTEELELGQFMKGFARGHGSYGGMRLGKYMGG